MFVYTKTMTMMWMMMTEYERSWSMLNIVCQSMTKWKPLENVEVVVAEIAAIDGNTSKSNVLSSNAYFPF